MALPAYTHRISKRELAELAAVCPAVITKKFPESHPAVLRRKVELDHPDVQLYLEQREARIKRKAAVPKSPQGTEKGKSTAPAMPNEVPRQELPEELAAMTLGEIVEKFGHVSAFKSHVGALKELEAYRAKQLGYEKDRGQLVDKESEGNLIFEILENLFRRLVEDIPQTLTQRVISIARKGDDDAEMVIQREYQSANSRALKVAKMELIDRLGEQEVTLLGAS